MTHFFKELLIVILLIFFSCSRDSAEINFQINDVGNRDKTVQTITQKDIIEIVQLKDYTLFYFYTTWCMPCIQTLRTDIKEALDTINDTNISIAIIGLAEDRNKILQLTNKIELNYVNYYLKGSSNIAVHNKYQVNNILKDVFSEFENVNYFPICFICDKNNHIIKQSGFSNVLKTYYEEKYCSHPH